MNMIDLIGYEVYSVSEDSSDGWHFLLKKEKKNDAILHLELGSCKELLAKSENK